jgi:hypothetical protein
MHDIFIPNGWQSKSSRWFLYFPFFSFSWTVGDVYILVILRIDVSSFELYPRDTIFLSN